MQGQGHDCKTEMQGNQELVHVDMCVCVCVIMRTLHAMLYATGRQCTVSKIWVTWSRFFFLTTTIAMWCWRHCNFTMTLYPKSREFESVRVVWTCDTSLESWLFLRFEKFCSKLIPMVNLEKIGFVTKVFPATHFFQHEHKLFYFSIQTLTTYLLQSSRPPTHEI